jgi:hypothetical protein
MADKSNESSLLSKALKVVSLPVAAISGYIVTSINIRHSAYENAKDHGMFKDLSGSYKDAKGNEVITPRQEAMHALGEKVMAAEKIGQRVDVLAESIPLHANYGKSFTKRMETAKLGSFVKQWRFTSPFQQQNALINGLTVAGVAIGAILSIANMKTIQHAFSSQDAEKSDGPSV